MTPTRRTERANPPTHLPVQSPTIVGKPKFAVGDRVEVEMFDGSLKAATVKQVEVDGGDTPRAGSPGSKGDEASRKYCYDVTFDDGSEDESVPQSRLARSVWF